MDVSPLFAGLSPTNRTALDRQARRRHFDSGETLFAQGNAATHLFVILNGRVRVWRATENGSSLLLTLLGAGQPLGVLGAIDHRVNHATATAIDGVDTLVWDVNVLHRMMAVSGELTANVLRTVTTYAEQLIERLEETSSLPVERRLARTLLRAAERLDGIKAADGVTLELSRQDLAELISATLPTVSRIMSLWRRKRWIDGARGQVTLLDCDAVKQVAALPDI